MAELVKSERVDSPDGGRVQVLFYDDSSIRFRIYECPLVIQEAFLTGNKNDHSIIKVAPAAPPATVAASDDSLTVAAELHQAKNLLRDFLERFYWLKDHPDYFAEVRSFLDE